MCKIFFLIPLNNNLSPEKTENFSIFYDRITKTPIVPHAVTFVTLKLKSKRLFQLFVSFSLVTGFFEGTRENIVHIFRA